MQNGIRNYDLNVVEHNSAYAATFQNPSMLSNELSNDELNSIAGAGFEVDGCPQLQSCGKFSVSS